MMKVKNIIGNAGCKVKNQFVLTAGEVEYFQSYDSIIAKKENGKVYLDSYYWNYSSTTSKYLAIFLSDTNKELKDKVKNGTYILTNLNK